MSQLRSQELVRRLFTPDTVPGHCHPDTGDNDNADIANMMQSEHGPKPPFNSAAADFIRIKVKQQKSKTPVPLCLVY